MKLHGKILGVSEKCFYTVVLACTIGILLGSFFDFQINERLAIRRRECVCTRG